MGMKAYTGGELMCKGYLVQANDEEWIAVDAPAGFADWVRQELPRGARLSHLLITHQHFDHIQDAAALQQATGCKVHACMPYQAELTLAAQAAAWGIAPPEPFRVDEALGAHDSDATWGGLRWKVLHVPGHSPDSMVYALPEEGVMYVGDVLFAGSIGRTDLPGGDAHRLVHFIRTKIMPYPPDTGVFPGHGPATGVGEEELNNPFIQG